MSDNSSTPSLLDAMARGAMTPSPDAAGERFAHPSVRRTYHAEPFSDAELNRTVPTLRAPAARRKAPRR